MLTGVADPVAATGVPPEGFVRLAPAARQAPGDHREGVRPGAGVVLSFLVAVGAALVSLQMLIPWAPWRAVMPAAGVLVVFGGLDIWARLIRRGMVAGQPCACERPPVWIRVIPSVAQNPTLWARARMERAQAGWIVGRRSSKRPESPGHDEGGFTRGFDHDSGSFRQ